MTRFILIILMFIFSLTPSYADITRNEIHSDEYGHVLMVFDHRPGMLDFMYKNGLQGGGPTWMGLITAALNMESPSTLMKIEFDDESDVVWIRSESKRQLKIVQKCVKRLMTEKKFMERSIATARAGGYIE